MPDRGLSLLSEAPAEGVLFALGLLAVACLLLALFWGLLFPDPLRRRMLALRGAGSDKTAGGRGEAPGGWRETLYPPLLWLSQFTTRDLRLRLRRSGLHGRNALVLFMLVKVLAPLVLFPIFWRYFDLTLADRLPGWLLVVLAAGLALASAWTPDLFLRNVSLRRRERIKRAWPDALVLMRLCISAGLGLEAALAKVAREMREISSEVAEELDITVAELIYFQNRREALHNLGERIDLPSVREVALALAQAERYGMALSATLHRLADESRKSRLAEAEKKAASLPALLTVPMILFFLPALFVVILTPALIQVFGLN